MKTKLFIMLLLVVRLGGSVLGQQVPTPEEALGFAVGSDFKLATYDESLAYFQQLDDASDKMQLVRVGETSQGRDWFFALISSPQNLANIEHYRSIAQQLAHPSGLSDADARRLVEQGKAIVHIDGGLHASEVAGAQHTIQLAYDLVNGAEDPMIRSILDNVIIMLWPSINPDGQNIVAEWYRSNVGTPYEIAQLPELYQKYIGHDNNRDAYGLNMIESRVVARTWRHWEPNIIYVHHQSSPFPTRIWLPPFAEPIANRAPPLISRELNTIGMAIAQMLETNGQPGAVHMGTGFDAWYPGYVDYMPVMQNIAAFWTETALYRYATPRFYTINDFPKNRRDLRAETLYPSPWQGGWWRLRDAVEYMHTASMATLDYAAKYRETLLYNKYQAGRNTIRKYENEPPFAYLIPRQQRDPVAPVELLRRLAFNGVKVEQLATDRAIEGIMYPQGTWVIPMNQEYGELARQVLEVQHYPDLREFPEGPPEQPYDAAGWTLPFQFGVSVAAVSTPLTDDFRAAMTPIQGVVANWDTDIVADVSPFDSVPDVGFDTNVNASGIIPMPGRATGSGSRLSLDPAQNNSFRAVNDAWRAGGTVRYGKQNGQGRYIVGGVSQTKMNEWVEQLALQAVRTGASGDVDVRSRVALYQPWQASIDAGWTQWLLERYGFDFKSIRNTDFKTGELLKRFDVIVMASDRPGTIKDGHAEGSVPPRYTGGLGATGVRNLDAFVQGGGTLVCLNQSSDFAITELNLPVKNVVKGMDRKVYFTGGSILEVETDSAHPIMAGMPDKADVFVWRSPVFTALENFKGKALAKYRASGSPLRSGYLLGEKQINGYAAAMDVQHGKGHVILLGFRPQWRGQPFGTFRVVFNAVLYGGALARVDHGTPDFWIAPTSPDEQ